MTAARSATPITAPMAALRDVLAPARLPDRVEASGGYLDLLADRPSPTPNLAQHAMQHPLLAPIYERLWRPAFTRAFSYGGAGTVRHTDAMLRDLALTGDKLILDVACGPGLHTRRLAARLGSEGLSVGMDLSGPMLRQAVRDSGEERAAYLRADAHDIPFADGTFDAVACLAALYLIPEPHSVIEEMVRVLAPGGRIGIFTSLETALTRVPGVQQALGRWVGGNVFGRDEITSLLGDLGLWDVRQQISGQGQFVSARKHSALE